MPGFALTSADIEEIGAALYGPGWRSDMAAALGVPRQSVSYYIKAGGANGAQASAIIGLIARALAGDMRRTRTYVADAQKREVLLHDLLERFEGA
jgi:hypothetical protein